jgi:hypothetical protein
MSACALSGHSQNLLGTCALLSQGERRGPRQPRMWLGAAQILAWAELALTAAAHLWGSLSALWRALQARLRAWLHSPLSKTAHASHWRGTAAVSILQYWGVKHGRCDQGSTVPAFMDRPDSGGREQTASAQLSMCRHDDPGCAHSVLGTSRKI